MIKIATIASAGALVLLTACSPGQQAQVQTAISDAQSGIATAVSALNTACSAGSSAAAAANANPLVGGNATVQNLLGWLSGACVKGGATGAIVQAAVNDPNGIQNTVNWVTNLFNSLAAAVK